MRYGSWLLALIVLTLVAFGGWLWWNHQAEQKAGERSEQLSKTLNTLQAGDKAAAAKQANALAEAKQPGYRAAALLIKAALGLEGGENKAAIRSEERRVGEGEMRTCRTRWCAESEKKKKK